MFKFSAEFETLEELQLFTASVGESVCVEGGGAATVDTTFDGETTIINTAVGQCEDTAVGQCDIALTDTPELDASGVPWDPRIHATTKTRTAKDMWKKKRGIDDEVFNSVMAELQSGGINHTQLLDKIISQVAEGLVSIFTVQDALTELGLQSINDASGNPDMIEKIAELLGVE